MRLIDADAMCEGLVSNHPVAIAAACAPTVDAVEVIRCKDCVYWKPRHIKLNDGSERAYLPGEDYVDITVGINVGSQCMVDEYSGYGCDKSVFRRKNDFCSRGIRKMDAEVQDVPQD